jgi:hypothetical protein
MIALMSVMAVAPVGAVASPPAITPQSITFPIVEAECTITDTQGRGFNLDLRQTGGRGYPISGADGSAQRGRTDLRTEVLEDTTGRFRHLEFERSPRSTWPGHVRAFEGRRPDIQFETVETDDRDKYAILIRTKWPMPAVSYVGLCSVKKIPQVALTGPEAEKALKQ